jgi:hypothetical protein
MFSRKFSDRHRATVDRHGRVELSVISLLSPSGPATVAGFVVAVYVYTVQRMCATWSWADRSKKGREVIFPCVTDLYSSSSIIRKSWRARIIASAFSVRPCSVLFRLLSLSISSARRSMFQQPSTVDFCSQAITAARNTSDQTSLIDVCDTTTITTTGYVTWSWALSYDNQATESVTDLNGLMFRHATLYA